MGVRWWNTFDTLPLSLLMIRYVGQNTLYGSALKTERSRREVTLVYLQDISSPEY